MVVHLYNIILSGNTGHMLVMLYSLVGSLCTECTAYISEMMITTQCRLHIINSITGALPDRYMTYWRDEMENSR